MTEWNLAKNINFNSATVNRPLNIMRRIIKAPLEFEPHCFQLTGSELSLDFIMLLYVLRPIQFTDY